MYQALDDSTGARDLWYLPLKNPGPPIRLTETPHDEAMPQLSPDGRYLAYQSNESGRWEIYVIAFPNAGKPRRISGRGGIQPRWSYWSEELFYIRQNNMMATPIRTGSKFRVLGPPVRLFRRDFEAVNPLELAYDVTSDGQRFVIVGERVNTSVSKVVVMENWLRGRSDGFRHPSSF